MKPYQLLCTCLLALCCTYEAVAQKTFNNSIKLHTGGFYIKDRYESKRPTRFLGTYYERQLYRGLGIAIGYSQWKSWWPYPMNKVEVHEPLSVYDTAHGTLETRKGYKMVDVYSFYSQNILNKKHFLKVAVGVSCTWGLNFRIEHKSLPIEPIYNDTWKSYTEKTEYWGLLPQIGYDYLFLKNRLCVGIDLRGRYYKGIKQAQYDYGVHAGFNF